MKKTKSLATPQVEVFANSIQSIRILRAYRSNTAMAEETVLDLLDRAASIERRAQALLHDAHSVDEEIDKIVAGSSLEHAYAMKS